MKSFQFRLLLLPLCLATTLTEAKMRGEREGNPFQKSRKLLENVFSADALRHSLSTRRAPHQDDPFRDEPKLEGLVGRKDARAREFRMMKNGGDNHAAATAETTSTDEQPMLDVVIMSGKGVTKRQGMMMMMKSSSSIKGGKGGKGGMMSGKSKGKSNKSKGKGKSNKSKGKGGMKSSSSADTDYPTYAPTVHGTAINTPTTTPMLTDKPTCAPSTGVFTPDISDFFQAPSGMSSDLQNELDSALSEIQVPSEFETQCVEK